MEGEKIQGQENGEKEQGQDLVQFEKKRQWVIPQHHPIKHVWNWIIIIIALWETFSEPMEIAFEEYVVLDEI